MKDQIAQAKADMAAENARVATEQAELEAQAYRIRLDQNASEEVMRRRYQSRLPLVYEPQNLFNTLGAGTGNQPTLNQAGAPGAGAPVQPRTMNPPRQNNIVPQYVPTPSGHYSNPLDNIVAVASRFATLPIDGESPVAIETSRARELLQTALTQQQAYSRSRERIHSTPIRVGVSSSARHHNSP